MHTFLLWICPLSVYFIDWGMESGRAGGKVFPTRIYSLIMSHLLTDDKEIVFQKEESFEDRKIWIRIPALNYLLWPWASYWSIYTLASLLIKQWSFPLSLPIKMKSVTWRMSNIRCSAQQTVTHRKIWATNEIEIQPQSNVIEWSLHPHVRSKLIVLGPQLQTLTSRRMSVTLSRNVSLSLNYRPAGPVPLPIIEVVFNKIQGYPRFHLS